jgi:hypothetical protein
MLQRHFVCRISLESSPRLAKNCLIRLFLIIINSQSQLVEEEDQCGFQQSLRDVHQQFLAVNQQLISYGVFYRVSMPRTHTANPQK